MRTGIIVLLSVVAFALSSGGYALAGEAHDAALNGAAGSLEVILRESPESVDSCDDSGNTPLFYAAGRGDSEIISVLLKYGADPNAMNAESKTALFYASDVSAAVALVEAGADITRRDQAGNGPLHYAARANGVELARYFIEKGQDASEKNAAGETPVHASAGPEMTRLLLESGSCQIDADARNAEGRTPIFFAQDPVTAGMLIESGADVNAADSEGRTALSCALQNSNPALADYLIDSDAELDARDAAGRTALFYAGDAELAVKMAAKGADKNIRDANGLTPLLAFLQRENLVMAETMAELGADINARDANGNSPLHVLVSRENYEAAERFIEKGADVNARNLEGRTPLFYSNNAGVIAMLAARGADMNAADNNGWTPVMNAIVSGYCEAVNYFVDNGAELNAVNRNGFTALYFVNDTALFEKMVEKGARKLSGHKTRPAAVEEESQKNPKSTVAGADHEKASAPENTETITTFVIDVDKADLDALAKMIEKGGSL